MNRRAFLWNAIIGVAGIGLGNKVTTTIASNDLPLIPTGVSIQSPPLPVTLLTSSGFSLDRIKALAESANLWPGDPDRSAALYAMYITHVAKPYGVAPMVYTLDEFMALDRAHCGDYSHAQHLLNQALGLESRLLAFTDGWHGWVEVKIAGLWHIFDSTTNLALNVSMEALLAGQDCQATALYTPCLDDHAPTSYRAHLQEGRYPGYYSVPALRADEPYMGKLPGYNTRTITSVSTLEITP